MCRFEVPNRVVNSAAAPLVTKESFPPAFLDESAVKKKKAFLLERVSSPALQNKPYQL